MVSRSIFCRPKVWVLASSWCEGIACSSGSSCHAFSHDERSGITESEAASESGSDQAELPIEKLELGSTAVVLSAWLAQLFWVSGESEELDR